MSRIEFYQTNYIGTLEDKSKIKLCPNCHTTFSEKEDTCPQCDLYLPSFPTSWVRSATNIFLLRKVLEFINIDLKGSCNVEELSKVLTGNYVISFDSQRANDPSYWRGSPMRRTSEYLNNLQYLGLIKKNDRKYDLTDLGRSLAEIESYSSYVAIFAKSFMELKISNEHDTLNFYSDYNNHLLFQSLKMLSDLNKEGVRGSIENIALAIMAKDEEGEYKKALNTSLKFDHNQIKKMWFSRGQEFNRVVRGVFIRWLNQTKLIDIELKDGTIFADLTKFGLKVLDLYTQAYKNRTDMPTIENLKSLIELSMDQKYLRLSVSSEENNRVGADWESTVKSHFNKLNLEVEWYRLTRDFENINLPTNVLISLTGGTKFNPDLILHDPLWLIDPKKDVNAEMHKVFAYDTYGEIVNGLSIIVSQKIMRQDKINMMNESNLNNVLVIDGYALQVLSDNSDFFTKEKVIEIIKNIKSDAYYLSEEIVFDKYIN